MATFSSGGSNVTGASIVDESISNADISPTAAIETTKLNIANAIDNTELNDEYLNKTKVSLSAAQIIALNTTPVTLIAAPGAGKVLVIDSILGIFKPGGTQFTGTGTDMMIREETSATTLVDNAFSAANITGATQIIKNLRLQLAGGHMTLTANKGAYITLLTNSFATGNGTLDFHITYRITTV